MPDIKSTDGNWGGNVPLVLVIEDQGGAVIGWNKEEISPTLRAEMHGHLPMVLIEDEDIDREEIF